jgi:hypothetical protein
MQSSRELSKCAVTVPMLVISLDRLNRSSMSSPTVSTEFFPGPHHCAVVSEVSGSLPGGVGVSYPLLAVVWEVSGSLSGGVGVSQSEAGSSRLSSAPFSIVSADPSMLISFSDPAIEPKMVCSTSPLDGRVESMAGSE